MTALWSIGIVLPLAAWAQTDASAPAFDAASVKVSAPLPSDVVVLRMGGGPDSSDPSRIAYRGVDLKALVAQAYNVKEYQVEGPSWIESERYDVIATIPKGAAKDQVRFMMQRLLAERFKLTLQRQTKPISVYTLSVAKGGAKLREIDADNPPPPAPLPPSSRPIPPPPLLPPGGGPAPKGLGLRIMMGRNSRYLAGNSTVAHLCDLLANFMDRPVIDLTELEGTYSFDLSWTPDDSEKTGGKLGMAMALVGGGAAVAPGGPPAPERTNDPGQTLAQALRNGYGLKLEPRKYPAEILVIGHAEKVPTEN